MITANVIAEIDKIIKDVWLRKSVLIMLMAFFKGSQPAMQSLSSFTERIRQVDDRKQSVFVSGILF